MKHLPQPSPGDSVCFFLPPSWLLSSVATTHLRSVPSSQTATEGLHQRSGKQLLRTKTTFLPLRSSTQTAFPGRTNHLPSMQDPRSTEKTLRGLGGGGGEGRPEGGEERAERMEAAHGAGSPPCGSLRTCSSHRLLSVRRFWGARKALPTVGDRGSAISPESGNRQTSIAKLV